MLCPLHRSRLELQLQPRVLRARDQSSAHTEEINVSDQGGIWREGCCTSKLGVWQNVILLTLVWSGGIFLRIRKPLSQAPGPRQNTHKQPCHALQALGLYFRTS